MTIDRWSSMTASSSPRAQVAPRTPCGPCTARGHHCDAFDVVGGRAVCIHCLDGVDCPKTPRNGVVDAVRRSSAVLTSARTLSPRECAGMRGFHKAGKSLEWLAVEFGVTLTRVEGIVKELPAEEREEQRRSFAHGNVSMHNPDVTRAAIDKAADRLAAPPPTTPQPALAPGAEPSAAMPARRAFVRYKGKVQAREKAKGMLASGMSLSATVAATGLSRNTVSSVRKELPGLPRAGKGGVPRKAAEMSAAAAEHVVAEAEAITAEVAGEIARRSVSRTEGELAAKSEEVFSKLKEEHAVFPIPPKADELTKNRWTRAPEVMDLADVPGGRVSAYDGAVAKLRAAPVGKVTCFSYATEALAETYRDGIAKRAHRAGLMMSSRLVGTDLYVWLREKA